MTGHSVRIGRDQKKINKNVAQQLRRPPAVLNLCDCKAFLLLQQHTDCLRLLIYKQTQTHIQLKHIDSKAHRDVLTENYIMQTYIQDKQM